MLHDPLAEQHLIGAIMTNPAVITQIADLVDAADLYELRNRRVFEAVLALHRRGESTDALPVLYELEARGDADLAEYVHHCMAGMPVTASAGFYARIIALHARRRGVLEISTRGVHRAEDVSCDPDELGADMIRALREAAAPPVAGRAIAEAADACFEELTMGSSTVYPTGLVDLDKLLGGGFRAPQLITVAGRPGTGKSIFGTELIRRCCPGGTPVSLVSIEMIEFEITLRLYSAWTRIPLQELRAGLAADDLRWPLLAEARDRMREWSSIIVDRLSLLDGIVAGVHRHRQHFGDTGIAIIDYLQLMEVSRRHDNRVGDVSEMSRTLKVLAGEIGWPVVMMSQLNRGPEGRPDKRPQLADLRESGSIEQDSDIVILHHLPPDRPGELDLIVAKNRHGPTGVATVAEHFHICRLANLTRQDDPPTSAWD